jgi:hypothetical protein
VDFFQIGTKEAKGGVIEVFPDFTVGRSKDLMVRGRSFYAIWDEEKGLWSTDEYDVQRLVDQELSEFAEKLKKDGFLCTVKYLRSFGSNSWSQFQNFLSKLSDSSHQLDQNLTFSNTEVTKSDYVSRRLPYPLEPGEHSAWDELVRTLYSADERAKIEWAIGSVVAGDSKKIQKFLCSMVQPERVSRQSSMLSNDCFKVTPQPSKPRRWVRTTIHFLPRRSNTTLW